LPPQCGRSRPPWSNTQANHSRPRCRGAVRSARSRRFAGPAAGLRRALGTSGRIRRARAARLGKTLSRRHVRTLFPQASRCDLCISPVENSRPKCDRFFLLHTRWIVSDQVTDGLTGHAGGPSTSNPPDAHKLATGFSTSYPQGLVGSRVGGRQNVRTPRMSDPFGRTVSAGAGRYVRGGGVR